MSHIQVVAGKKAHMVARRSATISICRPSGCRSTLVHRSPLVTRSTTPHSQIALASSAQLTSAPLPKGRRRAAPWGRSAS